MYDYFMMEEDNSVATEEGQVNKSPTLKLPQIAFRDGAIVTTYVCATLATISALLNMTNVAEMEEMYRNNGQYWNEFFTWITHKISLFGPIILTPIIRDIFLTQAERNTEHSRYVKRVQCEFENDPFPFKVINED